MHLIYMFWLQATYYMVLLCTHIENWDNFPKISLVDASFLRASHIIFSIKYCKICFFVMITETFYLLFSFEAIQFKKKLLRSQARGGGSKCQRSFWMDPSRNFRVRNPTKLFSTNTSLFPTYLLRMTENFIQFNWNLSTKKSSFPT